MLYAARKRARLAKVPFNIDKDDIVIPEHCPVFGVPIISGVGWGGARTSSPSLDRIVPELGYTKGNVAVISHRANCIKSNATLPELEAVASWLRAVIRPS